MTYAHNTHHHRHRHKYTHRDRDNDRDSDTNTGRDRDRDRHFVSHIQKTVWYTTRSSSLLRMVFLKFPKSLTEMAM